VKFPLEINTSAGFASGREGDDGKHRIQALADVGWGGRLQDFHIFLFQ
jgi:hypothetical protein